MKTFMALMAALLVSSCTHYEYQPPSTEGGRQCVAQCAGVKEMCISNENTRAQNTKFQCERRNQVNYQNCVARASTKDEVNECSRRQTSCNASAATYRCENDYRTCYTNCGGKVLQVESK